MVSALSAPKRMVGCNMATIIHLKNVTPAQREKLARDNEARLNNLTPAQQFDRIATQNMIRTLETIGYFDSPKDEYTWPLDDDFGGY